MDTKQLFKTLAIFIGLSFHGPFSFAAEEDPCLPLEPAFLNCIEHPDNKVDHGTVCNDPEKAFLKCTIKRREETADTKLLMQWNLVHTRKKLDSYKKAKDICNKTEGACDPAKVRIIEKMLKGLPREIEKMEKHLKEHA